MEQYTEFAKETHQMGNELMVRMTAALNAAGLFERKVDANDLRDLIAQARQIVNNLETLVEMGNVVSRDIAIARVLQ